MRTVVFGLALGVVVYLGCGAPREAPVSVTPSPAVSPSPSPAPTPARGTYSSGLGELMGLAQMRHSKLWFAGEAGNWKLAAYELGELKEGFDDVVHYFPTHKESPVPIDQAVESMIVEPMADLSKAIEKGDRREFEKAFDVVTDACNACHQATDHPYLVLQRPKANPYSNQIFAPQK